jgi:hypothetical protein
MSSIRKLNDNAYKVTDKKLLRKSNISNLRAGRHLVQQKHVEESAAKEAVADSLEWNIVRMDLLAHYN